MIKGEKGGENWMAMVIEGVQIPGSWMAAVIRDRGRVSRLGGLRMFSGRAIEVLCPVFFCILNSRPSHLRLVVRGIKKLVLSVLVPSLTTYKTLKTGEQ